jgi:transcriptional regulator
MSTKTTIQISRETKTKLNELGKKGDSYDAIIQKLLKNYDENH